MWQQLKDVDLKSCICFGDNFRTYLSFHAKIMLLLHNISILKDEQQIKGIKEER